MMSTIGAMNTRDRSTRGTLVRKLASRRRNRLAIAAGLCCAVIVLAGCSEITAVLRTDQALAQAGYNDPQVNISSSSSTGDVINVTVDALSSRSSPIAPATSASTPSTTPLPSSGSAPSASSQPLQVASIVWNNYPYRFSELNVQLRGLVTASWSFGQLRAVLGARPTGFSKLTAGQALAHGAKGIAVAALVFLVIAAVVGLAVIVGIVILIVHLVNRSRQRRLAGPYGQYPGAQYPSAQYPAGAMPTYPTAPGFSETQGYPGFPRYPQPAGPNRPPPPPPPGAPHPPPPPPGPPPAPAHPSAPGSAQPGTSGLFGTPAGSPAPPPPPAPPSQPPASDDERP